MSIILNEKKMAIACGATLAWFAVILQLVLMIRNRTTPVAEVLARFFTFFTILTNILAALCFTFLLRPASRAGGFFSRPGTLTAVAVYIFVVGIVYNTLLRSLWHPQGSQRLVDELLHVVNPAYFLICWLIFVRRVAGAVEWRAIFSWLIYPLAYLLLILLRGALSDWYPYPFVDVAALGYARVLVNSGLLMAAFLVLSALFLALAKTARDRKAAAPRT